MQSLSMTLEEIFLELTTEEHVDGQDREGVAPQGPEMEDVEAER